LSVTAPEPVDSHVHGFERLWEDFVGE
jgi:hypothetical protein